MSDPRQRLVELDALRGVAVLLVMAFHYTARFGELYPSAAGAAPAFPFGAYGVHLFFVISGFVIIMTLDRSERAADFLLARFSRLYPAYWTAILITAATLWFLDGPVGKPSVVQVVQNFTMLQGFFNVPSVDGVYWTLEVELLFYVMALAVFCLGLLRRVHFAVLAWLALAALFASPLWEAHVAGAPFAGLAARVLILEFAPFFSIGILFYRLYRNQGAAAWNYALIAAALAVIMASQPFAVSLLMVAACGVLWKLAHGGLPALRFGPLVFVGTISYSLYLLHQKIGYSLMLSLLERGWSAGAAMAAAATLSIGLATAVTFLVEKPALHAIRRQYKALRARAADPSYRTA